MLVDMAGLELLQWVEMGSVLESLQPRSSGAEEEVRGEVVGSVLVLQLQQEEGDIGEYLLAVLGCQSSPVGIHSTMTLQDCCIEIVG